MILQYLRSTKILLYLSSSIYLLSIFLSKNFLYLSSKIEWSNLNSNNNDQKKIKLFTTRLFKILFSIEHKIFNFITNKTSNNPRFISVSVSWTKMNSDMDFRKHLNPYAPVALKINQKLIITFDCPYNCNENSTKSEIYILSFNSTGSQNVLGYKLEWLNNTLTYLIDVLLHCMFHLSTSVNFI